MDQPSLFDGDAAWAPAQGSLFGTAGPAEVRRYVPEVADIRRRLGGLLAAARRAEQMPWSARDARMWQAVFPQMAGWLPEAEAAQMRLDFAREMARLAAAG